MLSYEIARRTILIQFDPNLVQPEKRTNFRHPNLEEWVQQSRQRLQGAILTLILNWVAKGMPRSQIRKASYEQWSSVVGGILEVNGIEGFLANEFNLMAMVQAETEPLVEWLPFTHKWWAKWGDTPMNRSELLELARQGQLLKRILGGGTERALLTKLGLALPSKRSPSSQCSVPNQ